MISYRFFLDSTTIDTAKMGNRASCSPKRAKMQANVPKPSSDTRPSHEQHNDEELQSNILNEHMYVTARTGDDTVSSQLESDNSSSVMSSIVSISEVSARGQHIIRDSMNNFYFSDSTTNHVGDIINCHGPVTFSSTSQSNVQINNQHTSMVHDFGNLELFF